MWCFRQVAITSLGQRFAWISPTGAFRRKCMQSRDCPMPPPIDKGILPWSNCWCHKSFLRASPSDDPVLRGSAMAYRAMTPKKLKALEEARQLIRTEAK
jgi:hypothetical protein